MKLRLFILLTVASLLSGCIENDLPYPYIKGEVLSIDIEGATQSKIDPTTQTVFVTLCDTVDLRSVRVNSIEITENSRSTLNSGDVLNMTNGVDYAVNAPYDFTISTFQKYEWKLVIYQPINRVFRVSNTIGDAIFDLDNHIAIVNVAESQDLYNVTVEEISLAPSVATYSPDPYLISNFSRGVEVEVSYFGVEELWTLYVQHSTQNVITGDANPWSAFAYLSGSVLPNSKLEAGFEYRRAVDTEWLSIELEPSNGTISGIVNNLMPNNSYVYRAFLGDEFGEEKTFTTNIEPEVPNLNFDEAVKEGVIWYFNSTGTNSYWATGNEGVAIMNKSNTISVEGSEARNGVGRAVKMETFNGVPFAQVAAGNLFTGTYETKMGTPQTMLTSATMGRPYSGRPTVLRGYYKYTPGIITESSYWQSAAEAFGYNFADSVGKRDWSQIYIQLEKWPVGVDVRPDESQIEVIAYGSHSTNEDITSYTEFEIPIKYYDIEKIPNHVSIVATSSINGGYFCGAAGSVLYVDDFSLGFEYLGN